MISTTDKSIIFSEITQKMAAVYAAKNHDYGNAFSKSFDEFGVISAAVRMNDKMERIKSLAKMNPEEIQVKSESMQDTLLDLANYAVMTLVEMRVQAEKACDTQTQP